MLVEEPETPKSEEDPPEDLGLEEDIPGGTPGAEIPGEGGEETPQGEGAPADEGEPIFEIDGQGVTLAEAQKGYQRHADYTKKTQALADEKKRLEPFRKAEELLKTKPALSQKIRDLIKTEMGAEANPTDERMTKIEERQADDDLDRDIQKVKAECKERGDEFDEQAILKVAQDEGLPNFRAAYKSWAFEKQRAKGRSEEATHQAGLRTGKVSRSGGPKDRKSKPVVIRDYGDAVEASKKEMD